MRCRRPVDRFTLNRDAYRHSVVQSIKKQRAAREQFIAQVKTFAKMRPNQRAKVADALQKVNFAPSEQIIRQGDDGDLFYIIEKGDVIITENDSDLNMVFGVGKFFGEIALTENVPRTSHVHAGASGADCLTLDRSAFNRLFGQAVLDEVANANEKVLKTASKVYEVKAAVEEPQRPMLFGEDLSLEAFNMGAYVGFGAFGFVRIAKHKETGQMCAIKGMSKGYLISKNQARHAIGERDLLKDCNHPVRLSAFVPCPRLCRLAPLG
jgi:CRP-like cAMP-binding protein